MTVLDAYAVVAFLRDEPAAEDVAELLRTPTVLSATNAAEVVDRLVRAAGLDPDEIHADLGFLERAGLAIAPVTRRVGLEAGLLRARHYHRVDRPLSLADCTAAATALVLDRALATSDPPLAAMARAEGGTVHALPDSRGRRP